MAPAGSSTMTQAVINRNNTQAQIKRRDLVMKERNRVISHNESAWFEIKDFKWDVSFPKDVRPSTQPLCKICLPTFVVKEKDLDYNAYPMVDVTRTSRKSFWGLICSLFESLKVRLNLHSLDDRLVLEDERVINAIQSVGTGSESAALYLLKTLKIRFSNLKFRIFIWILCIFMKSEFRAVCINSGQIKMLRKASKKNNFVFFPLHRSSLDLHVLLCTLAKNALKLPVGDVEDSLSALREAMEGTGCISLDKLKIEVDPLYRAVSDAYLSYSWGSGSDAIVFPEGRISRSGKPYVGRGNAIYFFSKCYQDKTIQDAQVVPVSISYDKTIDDYIQGKSKWSLVFRTLFKTLFGRPQGGLIRVNFGRPFSFHDMMLKMEKMTAREEQLHMSVSSIALNQDENDVERYSYTVHNLMRHLLYDCSRLSPVMATQAIAFLLLYKGGKQSGMTMSELTSSLDDLREELTTRSVDTGFTGKSDDIVPYAVDLIDPDLIERAKRKDDIFLTPSGSLPKLLNLSRLANGVIVHFSLEGVVGRVLTSKLSEPSMTNVKIVDSAYELCEILQFEFVFTPSCVPLNDSIYQTFDDFVTSGILSRRGYVEPVRRLFLSESEEDSLGVADDYEAEPQAVPYALNLRHPKLKFFSGLVKPIIDVYACAVDYLYTLDDRGGLLEEEIVEGVLSCARTSLKRGILSQGESVSEETVINCLRLLEKWRVLDVAVENNLKIYIFTNAYQEYESRRSIYEKINKFT